MPLFYFDVYDGLSGVDRVGKDCPDHDAALREALRRAARLVAEQADWFRTGQEWQIGILDSEGASISVLNFRSATEAIIVISDNGRAAVPL